MKKLLINILNYHRKPLTHKQQAELLLSLCNLLDNGFTLLESFKFLNFYYLSKNVQLTSQVISTIKSGGNCYEVLKLLTFSPGILSQIYFAEQYGEFTNSLRQTAQYMQRHIKAKERFIKTIQYPIVLIIVFLGILTTLKLTVLPQFTQLYDTMNVPVSRGQHLLTILISYLPNIILLFSTLLMISVLIIKYFLKRIDVYKQIQFITHIPIANNYYKLLMTYKLANELALFYKNGISLQKIVSIYTEQNNDMFLNYLGQRLLEKSNQGQSLSQILKDKACFQNDLIKFLEQGEKSGKLDMELHFYSQILIQQFEERVNKHLKFIQPFIFIILGCFIITIYLVIMLPMFNLIQTIK
ncbi:competence type IV pilus assembly protein ComGB [Staphylococcus lugdunensis]|uniref:competence type IV pilus assembly protein ComGB n=1 Tax=Staphylococcus lugdunensis TaxID=28035 RepID=UPI0020942BD8|nr:competence type IV pilus assembly protein ComGB [Staphylococcus lugdunensis]MCO6561464.1 type II secretion system F family protein [Staphylococcus lugdunensis]MCO6566190.1 type II secretion system F family protein [Staphylococcus lugdunensis]MCO6569752.1 type II secretion system F family protein [Staphylococcus lugdunensis]MCO6571018.1 type II secretion system F family protein [Staphylococcus lugdunensis]MCO6588623.1 type II secretion system F family protein [Staphylococcus lugdunensis]